MSVDLSQYDADFEDAPAPEHSFDNLPDGKYEATVESVQIKTSKASGNPMVVFCLKIVGPNYAGRLLWDNCTLTTRPQVERLKSKIYMCGVRIGRLSELEARLDDFKGVRLSIAVKNKDEYVNIYFNKNLDDRSRERATEATRDRVVPPTPDDNIPF